MSAISIRELVFGYRQRVFFEKIDLEVESGEFLGIIGPNGSGKSTLLRLVGGILRVWKGEVRLLMRPIHQLTRREVARIVAFVPQESSFAFEWKVSDVVLMGRNPFLKVWEQPSVNDWRIVEAAMIQTGVYELRDESINEVSAGERQRVILARALVQQPEILLLDEATSHLDMFHRVEILQILSCLRAQGKTILFVSHDLNEAAVSCSRILLLSQGRIVACDTPAKVITAELIERCYGIAPVMTTHPLNRLPQVLFPAF